MTQILSDEAVAFVADLNRRFRPRRNELLAARAERRAAIAGGASLGFLPETAEIRAGDWTVPAAPADLTDRRVEITGPTERINNLMEDAATAEISRSQIWQWIHNGVRMDDGTAVTVDLVARFEDEELAKIRETIGDQAWVAGRFDDARKLFERVALSDDFADFLTTAAHDSID